MTRRPCLGAERWWLSLSGLAVSCYLDLYPVVLLAPLVAAVGAAGRSRLLAALVAAGCWAGLLLLSARALGDWSFLRSTYGFM